VVITTITSKGQTTIPNSIRNGWKTREVYWERQSDGSAVVRPVAGIMSLFGAAQNRAPRDAAEKTKAREAMGKKS